jgi:uncharacterized protein YciI
VQRLFAVIRSQGPAWNNALPLEQQADWRGHAAFMNALQAEGFVALGGPLEGTTEFLLIFRADDGDQIRFRLDDDPWTVMNLLRIARITPWTLRLGSLP